MIMKNNMNLKDLVLNNVLTAGEMILIKGGANGSGRNSSGHNDPSNAQSDDKRRERPGGGVTN
jgi:hypothetical protein